MSDTPQEQPRERLVHGLSAAITATGAYADVTIADIVRHAQTSKRTFYEHFPNKDACLFALYDVLSGQLLDAVRAAIEHAPPGEARVGIGVAVYLSALQAQPGLVRTMLVDILHLGAEGLAARRRVLRAFAELLGAEATAAGTGEIPPALAMALVGAVNELVLQAAEEDRIGTLTELAGSVATLVRGLLLALQATSRP